MVAICVLSTQVCDGGFGASSLVQRFRGSGIAGRSFKDAKLYVHIYKQRHIGPLSDSTAALGALRGGTSSPTGSACGAMDLAFEGTWN